MMSQKESGKMAEPEKSSSGSSNILHLFDEQWFFCNALNGALAVTKQPLHGGPAALNMEKTASSSARRLLRTPLAPPPPISCQGSGEEEDEPESRNYSSAPGRKLRYSYSSLDAPVQDSISSHCSSKNQQSTGRRRPPRTEAPHSRCPNLHLVLCWEARNRKAFQNKKWRSFGDLETMELQGFKDLGFVFDEREGLSSSLARVIPSLRERKEKEEDGEVRRLRLPEAWFAQRSAPPMILRRAGCWSGDEELKEQLRFWARAVAYNVRQDCS